MERALARRPRLAERLFTAAEREYAAARGRPAQHLAARFCAKEAVAKALGLTVSDPREGEALPPGRAPEGPVRGRAARRAQERGVAVHVSLTHSKGVAGAVAVAG